MEVRNCKGCGRLFNVITNKNLCPSCMNQLEDKFQEVKKYIEQNPGANIEVVSKECEVSVKQIKQWVKEERLTFTESSMDGVECERCGAIIRTGRYCDSCKNKITNNLRSAINPTVQPVQEKKNNREKDRMRFLQGL